MIATSLRAIDWFIPEKARLDRASMSQSRNFVFTHLAGPLLGTPIGVFLYFVDPVHDWALWTVVGCILSFWALPLLLKVTGNLHAAAWISSQLLTFVSLFGAFFYGGISSPFPPWVLVALLLAFFYLSGRPLMVLGGLLMQFAGFLGAYALLGHFPERVAIEQLAVVNVISVLGAFIYMTWMAIYYADVIVQRLDVEREAESHRLTAERLRAAMEEAETANRNKSIFLAKMSHELRTPLNAVIGYSELLLDDVDTANEQKLADLKRINGAGRHLLALVTDVLDLSRIEADGADEINIDVFEVKEFIDSLVGTIEALVKEKGNKFEIQCGEGLGTASTDALKLRQSLLNLLSNAAKFTHHGKITLRANRITDESGDWLKFEVADSGIGMDHETLERLFKSFAQATAGTAKKYGGTGLGLVITKRFAQMMGGDVVVTSTPGKGSQFTITIPAAAIAPPVREAAEPQASEEQEAA
jgi:signal transduction histidine kinase